jgi:hypothetical protein
MDFKKELQLELFIYNDLLDKCLMRDPARVQQDIEYAKTYHKSTTEPENEESWTALLHPMAITLNEELEWIKDIDQDMIWRANLNIKH